MLRYAAEHDYAVRPIWNVIATIPGTAEPDRLVVLGNHRDAWVYGAVDPNSGTASMLETARGLAASIHFALGAGFFRFVDLDSDVLLAEPPGARRDAGWVRRGPVITL